MNFSLPGLVVGMCVLGPNLLLLWFPPKRPIPAVRVRPLLVWLERSGQVLCLSTAALIRPETLWGGWSVLVGLALAGYYALWLRYLIGGRKVEALFRATWRVPVPLAILAVAVFLATALWFHSIWIGVAALVLAAGHIPISFAVARVLRTAGE